MQNQQAVHPLHKAWRAWAKGAGITMRQSTYARGEGGGLTYCQYYLPSAPPLGTVVMLHGTGNDHLYPSWQLYKSWINAGYAVFTFDLDGHGVKSTTQFNADHILTALQDAMATLLRQNPTRPLHIVGHSLGAALALHGLSQENDWGAASVTLVSLPLDLSYSPLLMVPELAGLVSPVVWEESQKFGFWNVLPAFGAFKRQEYPIRMQEASAWNLAYINLVRRILKRIAPLEAAAKIDIPALTICGGRDRIAPSKAGKEIAKKLVKGEFWELKPTNHLTTPMSPLTPQKMIHWWQELRS